MSLIHPTAVIEDGADVGADVSLGAYAVIGPNVRLGDGCVVGPRATVCGHTTVGPGTKIFSGAVIGDEPQDYSYNGGVSYTEIGANCLLREYVTIHRGASEGSITRVGDGSMLMTYVHVGHNCQIGNQVAIAPGTALAGHVEVGDNAFFSAYVLVHQFCRIGRLCMIGPRAIATQDVPPFCMLARTRVTGPNTVGLRRGHINAAARKAIKQAIRLYFQAGLSKENALKRIEETVESLPEIEEFISFVRNSKRGIYTGTRDRGE